MESAFGGAKTQGICHKEPCILCKDAYPFQQMPHTVQHKSDIHENLEALIQQVPFFEKPCMFCREACLFQQEPQTVCYLFQREPQTVQHKSQMFPAFRGANTAGTFLQRALYTLQRGLSIPPRAPHSVTRVSNTSRI